MIQIVLREHALEIQRRNGKTFGLQLCMQQHRMAGSNSIQKIINFHHQFLQLHQRPFNHETFPQWKYQKYLKRRCRYSPTVVQSCSECNADQVFNEVESTCITNIIHKKLIYIRLVSTRKSLYSRCRREVQVILKRQNRLLSME